MSVLDDLFAALADPSRRALFERLLRDGPASATTLAQSSAVSRQAIVKHLQALADAGLARTERAGREVLYTATPESLATVLTWLTESSSGWDRRLERLRGMVGRRG